MRILCLHGRRQSGSTLARKLFDSALCSGASGHDVVVSVEGFKFVFVNGPHVAQADLPKGAKARQVQCDMYSWWADTSEDGSKALRTLEQNWDKYGPFDGVLGFSQGGALAASLCRARPTLGAASPLNSWRPSVAIFLSAYYFDAFPIPGLIQGAPEDRPKPGIESLHVWGERDQVVPSSKSKLLCEWMQGDSMSISGGHAAPAVPWATTVLLPWLTKNQNQSRATEGETSSIRPQTGA